MPQTKYVFLLQVRVRRMIGSTYCIVFKMTYGMRDLTCFVICKINIMSFFLLGSRLGWKSFWTIILVWQLPFWASFFGWFGGGYFWEMNEKSTCLKSCLKKFETGCQNQRFSKRSYVFHLRIYLTGVRSKAISGLPASDLSKWYDQWIFGWPHETTVWWVVVKF